MIELTIDEKIRLLNGVGDWHTYDADGKLPSIMMTDGPHGIRKVVSEQMGDINGSKPATCFPTASAIASSWDPEVAGLMAECIAKEAIAEDISVVLGCGINIKRSPLCGRNFEYFSEDPYLTAKLATKYISTMQEHGVGTSLKHFAANSQETRRMTSNSQVDERALREIYLSAFEQVVKAAKPTTIMASYNKLNGDYACANHRLLTEILRDEWGYEGLVVSDWGACVDAVKCLKAGLDLEMPDNRGYHRDVIKKAYEEGLITEEEIDIHVDRILKLVNEATSGELHSRRRALSEQNKSWSYESHNDIAAQIETECAVLLKNDNDILPIEPDGARDIIVIGELAEHMRFQGGGSSHINAAIHKSAIDALRDMGYQVTYLQGYRNASDKIDKKLHSACIAELKDIWETSTQADAKKTPVILYFLGLTDIYEGEGYDRLNLNIPMNQVELLKEVSQIVGMENIAAISCGGAPMDYAWESNVAAILHMHLGGQGVGEAVAKLVSGEVNPSGRLAETIPLQAEYAPCNWNYAPKHDDIEYRESIYVGYRYYETYGIPVRFSFGYGLSYTRFEYSDLAVEGLDVTLKVRNVGDRAGKNVVQIYVIPEKGDFLRSATTLRGCAKIYLEPGEEREVTVRLDDRAYSVYDTCKGSFVQIAGDYRIAVGDSVRDIKLETQVHVDGEKYSRNERELYPEYFNKQPHAMNISQECFAKLYGGELSDFKSLKRGGYTIESSFGDVTDASVIGKIVKGSIRLGLRFMFPGKGANSPEMKMIRSGLEEGSLEGLIANSGGVVSPGFAKFLVKCANRRF